MPSNRIGRINEEIQRELSDQLRRLKDPRVSATGMVSITRVDTTGDLRYARIYVSTLDKARETEVLKGLKSAAGFLRRELGRALQLRYTPELQFIADDSIAHGAHIWRCCGRWNGRTNPAAVRKRRKVHAECFGSGKPAAFPGPGSDSHPRPARRGYRGLRGGAVRRSPVPGQNGLPAAQSRPYRHHCSLLCPLCRSGGVRPGSCGLHGYRHRGTLSRQCPALCRPGGSGH